MDPGALTRARIGADRPRRCGRWSITRLHAVRHTGATARPPLPSSGDSADEARRTPCRLRSARTPVRQPRIGVLLPLSGQYATYGQRSLNGIKLGARFAGRLAGREGHAGRASDRRAPRSTSSINDPTIGVVIGPLRSKVAEAVAPRAGARRTAARWCCRNRKASAAAGSCSRR